MASTAAQYRRTAQPSREPSSKPAARSQQHRAIQAFSSSIPRRWALRSILAEAFCVYIECRPCSSGHPYFRLWLTVETSYDSFSQLEEDI